MSLNHSQRRELRRIEHRLLRSEPHLAGMLAVFSKLSAGQRMPAWEQEPTRPRRRWRKAVLIDRSPEPKEKDIWA
jgi:hypothetical protein